MGFLNVCGSTACFRVRRARLQHWQRLGRFQFPPPVSSETGPRKIVRRSTFFDFVGLSNCSLQPHESFEQLCALIYALECVEHDYPALQSLAKFLCPSLISPETGPREIADSIMGVHMIMCFLDLVFPWLLAIRWIVSSQTDRVAFAKRQRTL